MKKNTAKLIRSASLIMCFMFLFSACKKNEEALTVNESSSVVVEDVVEEEEEEVEKGPQSMLTNELTDKDLSNVRPLCVMIENTKAAYPHYGLSEAGVVYEMPEEGGITRYMALYDDYEGYDRIGNIRSTRPYYVQIACEYDGIVAHIGQSVYAEILLRSMSPNTGIVDDINGILGNTSYFRTSDKSAPHNTYLSSESIIKDIENNGINREYSEEYPGHFKFAKEENLLPEGEDITEAHLYFYHDKPYFIYNPETKLYERYAFGAKEPDMLSKDGINFTNIIIQEAKSATHSGDPYIDLDVIGTGKGKFLTRGKMVDITWRKDADYSPTAYYMEVDGKEVEIELNTGKTYIAICEISGAEGNTYE